MDVKNYMKSLIIYYSLDGNTKFVSDFIKKEFESDVLELKLSNKFKYKGFFKFFWGGRQVMMKKCPEIENFDINFDNYDVVFIGTPVWVGTFAPPLRTFFNKIKLLNKKIVLFCCYGGSEGKTFFGMKKMLMGNEIISTFGIKDPTKNKQESEKEIISFIKSLNL